MAAPNSAVPKICLLLGVPTDYVSFVSRVKSSDWLSKFDNSLDGDDIDRALSERWVSEYSPLVAEPLLELMQVAKERNIDVKGEATLDMLREVTRTHRIVILFAHWKAYELLAEDLIQPVNSRAFFERANQDPTTKECWLCHQLQRFVAQEEIGDTRSTRRWWQLKSSRTDRLSLFEILSEAIPLYSNDIPNDADGVDRVLESELTRLSRGRDHLDKVFYGLLRPGNRLELFDGLHSKEDVETAVWSGFSGILDLTTCTSTILADYIANRRRQQVRTVQFRTVQEFLWAAKCVSIALTLFVDHGVPYQKARLVAGDTVSHTIGAMASANPSWLIS